MRGVVIPIDDLLNLPRQLPVGLIRISAPRDPDHLGKRADAGNTDTYTLSGFRRKST